MKQILDFCKKKNRVIDNSKFNSNKQKIMIKKIIKQLGTVWTLEFVYFCIDNFLFDTDNYVNISIIVALIISALVIVINIISAIRNK